MNAAQLETQAVPMLKAVQPQRVLIIADDLTGACDSGVAFLASGRSVRVVLNSDRDELYSEDVLSFTTETRNQPEPEAAERVARTLLPLLNEGGKGSLYFKKIDSAARGNTGAEVLAALESSHAALALVAPAFPHAGRTVMGGTLDIQDVAGQHTRIALRDLFPGVEDPHIAILPRATESELAEKLQRALRKGVRILLCDTATQQDLEHLAKAALFLEQPVLWAGSAGLARALATVLPQSNKSQPSLPNCGRTLLFVGTDHPVTMLQVSHLEAHRAESASHSIHHVDCQNIAPVRDAFSLAPTAALILTGGDTAAFVLRALGASSIVLAGEISPGIPWGTIHGGLADGCTVITKSGGFGAPDALARALEFCNRRAS